MNVDPYQIFKVHPGTKLEDIKKAYIELVKIHHPDKGGDAKVILKVNEAWEILKEKHKNHNLNKLNNSKIIKVGVFGSPIGLHGAIKVNFLTSTFKVFKPYSFALFPTSSAAI